MFGSSLQTFARSGRHPIRWRNLTGALAAASLCGCASYMHPYVPLKQEGVTPGAGDIMPELERSLSKIDGWIDDTTEKRDGASTDRRTLGVLTFGLATGAAITSVRSSSTNQLKNLGLGAGAAYTGMTLFQPADQVTLYNSAIGALNCIRSRGAALRSNIVVQKQQLVGDPPQQYLRSVLNSPANCTPDAATQRNLDAAEAAFAGVVLAAGQAEKADYAVAAKLEDGARNVVLALNLQMDQITPSTDAILGAAKSTLAVSNGLLASISPAQPRAAAPGGVPRAAQPCSASAPALDAVRSKLDEMRKNYDTIQSDIAAQLNAVGALDSACTLAAVQIGPLTLSQTDMTIKKDVTINVTITGGREPYNWTWSGTSPGNAVSVQLVPPRILVIGGTSTTAAGGPYKLSVTDSSVASKPVYVNVTTQ